MRTSRITVHLDMDSSFEEMAEKLMEAIAIPGDSVVHGANTLSFTAKIWVGEMWKRIIPVLREHEFEEEGVKAVRTTLVLQAWRQVAEDLFSQDVLVLEKPKDQVTLILINSYDTMPETAHKILETLFHESFEPSTEVVFSNLVMERVSSSTSLEEAWMIMTKVLYGKKIRVIREDNRFPEKETIEDATH